MPFHFFLGILLLGAVFSKRCQLITVIRPGKSDHRRLQQPLGNKIRESVVDRSGVSVILDGKTEVPGVFVLRQLSNVFTWSHKFDDTEREIREAVRICSFRGY